MDELTCRETYARNKWGRNLVSINDVGCFAKINILRHPFAPSAPPPHRKQNKNNQTQKAETGRSHWEFIYMQADVNTHTHTHTQSFLHVTHETQYARSASGKSRAAVDTRAESRVFVVHVSWCLFSLQVVLAHVLESSLSWWRFPFVVFCVSVETLLTIQESLLPTKKRKKQEGRLGLFQLRWTGHTFFYGSEEERVLNYFRTVW